MAHTSRVGHPNVWCWPKLTEGLNKAMEALGWSYVSYHDRPFEWEKWLQGWPDGPVAYEGDKTWFSDLEKARKAIA